MILDFITSKSQENRDSLCSSLLLRDDETPSHSYYFYSFATSELQPSDQTC